MLQYQINIEYWWVGLLTYLPFHLIHIVVWRVKTPRQDLWELFLFLLLLPAAAWLIGIGLTGIRWFPAPLILHFLVAANYIAIYPAFQASSPTVYVLCLLLRHPEGLTKEAIFRELTQASALEDRVKDLKQSRLVVAKDGELTLTTSGKCLAGFFVIYRRLLGLEQGAG